MRGFNRAVMDEKMLSLLFQFHIGLGEWGVGVGGGRVVTNDSDLLVHKTTHKSNFRIFIATNFKI